MKDDQAHSFENSFLKPVDDLIPIWSLQTAPETYRASVLVLDQHESLSWVYSRRLRWDQLRPRRFHAEFDDCLLDVARLCGVRWDRSFYASGNR